MKKLLTILLITLSPLVVAQETFTGHELRSYYGEYLNLKRGQSYNEFEAGAFGYYLQGIFDAATTVGWACSEFPVSKDQLAQVVSNFMEDKPELWGYPAAFIVLSSITNVFPCEEKP